MMIMNSKLTLQICLQYSIALALLLLFSSSSTTLAEHHPAARNTWQYLPVQIQGYVYCQTCKYAETNTFIGAKPIKGAKVKVSCVVNYKPTVMVVFTDATGMFFAMTPAAWLFDYKSCVVKILSSPLPKCSVPTNVNAGITGASVSLVGSDLYTTGPFGYKWSGCCFNACYQ